MDNLEKKERLEVDLSHDLHCLVSTALQSLATHRPLHQVDSRLTMATRGNDFACTPSFIRLLSVRISVQLIYWPHTNCERTYQDDKDLAIEPVLLAHQREFRSTAFDVWLSYCNHQSSPETPGHLNHSLSDSQFPSGALYSCSRYRLQEALQRSGLYAGGGVTGLRAGWGRTSVRAALWGRSLWRIESELSTETYAFSIVKLRHLAITTSHPASKIACSKPSTSPTSPHWSHFESQVASTEPWAAYGATTW